jgi:hypothetical protein
VLTVTSDDIRYVTCAACVLLIIVSLLALHSVRDECFAVYYVCTYHSMQLYWLRNDRSTAKYLSYIQEQEVPEESLLSEVARDYSIKSALWSVRKNKSS